MKAGIFYHEDFVTRGYTVLKHRVDPGFSALQNFIQAGRLKVFTPEISQQIEDLLLETHASRHIKNVKNDGYHDVALLSAAGTVQAAAMLAQGELDFAFCFVGTAGHHASYDNYWGFCFYNDVAMAVKELRSLNMKRIMIIDVDPHFGDGTRNLLGDDSDILHINFFASSDIPAYNTELNNYDIALGAAKDEAFLQALTTVLNKEWDYELLIVIFGHDSHREDYGGFQLTDSAFPQMAQQIKDFAGKKPVLFVLSGGAKPKVASTVIPAVVEVFLHK